MGTAVVIAFIFGWKLALVVLCFLPIVMLSGIIQGRMQSGNSTKNEHALEEGAKVSLNCPTRWHHCSSCHQAMLTGCIVFCSIHDFLWQKSIKNLYDFIILRKCTTLLRKTSLLEYFTVKFHCLYLSHVFCPLDSHRSH